MFHIPNSKQECCVSTVSVDFVGALSSRQRASTYLAKLFQATLRLVNIVGPFLDQAVPVLQHVLVRFQPWVKLENTCRYQLACCRIEQVDSGSFIVPVPSAGISAASTDAIVKKKILESCERKEEGAR